MLLVCALSRPAAAAPGDAPRPAASVNAHVETETSQVLPRWTPSAGLVTTYGQRIGQDHDGSATIHRRTTTNIGIAFGIADRAEVLADLPMILHQQGTTTAANGDPGTAAGLQASALGDLRLGVKGTILRTPRRGFGLGVIADITAPTGDRVALAGTGGVQFSTRVLAEQTMARGITVAANVGYLVRPDLRIGDIVIGDAVTLASAIRIPLDRRGIASWDSELTSHIGVVPGAVHPVVMRTGLRARLRNGVVLGLYGGGAPISTLGVADVHGLFALRWAPTKRLRSERGFDGAHPAHATEIARRHDERRRATEPAPLPAADPADPDRDGLLATADRCPRVPEDLDGYQDEDGCPELDNDGDGLRDVVDHCPMQPELINGALDWDGCPDRIVDGKVVPLRRLDPMMLLPRLTFAPGGAELDEATGVALSEFAELMHLNPWLGELTIRVYVRPSNNPVADRGLADKRARVVTAELTAHGVSERRVHVQAPRGIGAQVVERTRLAWANDPSSRIPESSAAPSGPTETLDRLLAGADQRARDQVAAPPGDAHDFAQGPDAQPDSKPDSKPGELDPTVAPPQPTTVSGAPR